MNLISQYFKEYRKRHKLTQSEMALILNTNRVYITRIESGEFMLPLSVSKKLIELLGEDERVKFIEIFRKAEDEKLNKLRSAL